MQIGLFKNSNSTLHEQMADLSKELNFELRIINDLSDAAIGDINGLVVSDNLSSSEDIAHIVKRLKNILFLNPEIASTLLSQDLSIICEEAEVELQIAGPAIHPQLFAYIRSGSINPYYVRAIKESDSFEEITFGTLYRILYWCAFFSEGDVRKFKMSASPAIRPDGILLYGRTESTLSVPVDIWFTNLGFKSTEVVKVFSQTEVIELDCASNTLMVKNKERQLIENYGSMANVEEAYIRSFVEHLQKKEHKPLNLPLAKFLKMVEFYDSIKQSFGI